MGLGHWETKTEGRPGKQEALSGSEVAPRVIPFCADKDTNLDDEYQMF